MRKKIEFKDKKAEREKLSLIIQETLRSNSHNDKLYKAMMKELKERVHINKVSSIMSSRNNLTELSTSEIYWLAKFLIEHASTYDIDFKIENLGDYFYDKEISEAEQVFYAKEEKEDYVVIPNVYIVKEKNSTEYVCINLSYQKAKELWDDGWFAYNLDSQREATLVNLGFKFAKKPTILDWKTDEIVSELLKGNLISNMVSCNILQTGMEKFEYNDETHELKMYTPLDLIDGAHRIKSTSMALSKNPNLEGHFQLKIFNMDIGKAQGFVRQEQKATSISENKTRSLEQNKFATITRNLNTLGTEDTNSMKGKISDIVEEVYNAREAYCLFKVIADNLEEQWEDVLNSPLDNKLVSEFLIEFFNQVTGKRYDDFKNIKNQESVATSNNMFILYMSLARKLYNNKEWSSLLDIFLEEELDFDINNPKWAELLILSHRYDKRIRRNIYSFVDLKFNDLKEVI